MVLAFLLLSSIPSAVRAQTACHELLGRVRVRGRAAGPITGGGSGISGDVSYVTLVSNQPA